MSKTVNYTISLLVFGLVIAFAVVSKKNSNLEGKLIDTQAKMSVYQKVFDEQKIRIKQLSPHTYETNTGLTLTFSPQTKVVTKH